MATVLELHQRVADKEGFRGTVRYLGPVATSKSADTIYAGIEWDDGTRGKNDGSVSTAEGTVVRYFSCRHGHGSFVKVELLDLGTDVVSALADRYCDTETALTGGAIKSGAGRAIPIMLVGDVKIREQQRLEKLSAAALSESRVSALFSPDALAASPGVTLGSLCPRLRELDLRATLISGWALLGELGRQLPSLQVLNISENRLQPAAAEALCPVLPAGDAGSDASSTAGTPSAAAASLVGVFPSLRVIVMNELRQPARKPAPAAAAAAGNPRGADAAADAEDDAETPGAFWAAFVAPLHVMAPRLEEIHAARNRIRGVVARPARPLLLMGAAADAAGGAAPALGVSAGYGAGPGTAFVPEGLFPRLRVLDLSDNEVAEWGQVHALSRLPSLAVLQLSNNALQSVWTETTAPTAMAPRAAAAAGATADAPAAPAGASVSAAAASASVDAPAYFPALEQLSLSGNALADLASLDALDGLRCLSSLRLTNSDIAAAAARSSASIAGGESGAAAAAPLGPSEARQVIVARLPKLLSLNNSEVRPREREDAEKAYTRRVGQAFAASLGKEAITDVFPPQYVPQERVLSYIAGAAAAAAAASGAVPSSGAGGDASSAPAAPAAASSTAGLPPSAAALPAAFQKTGDSGVIRAPRAVDVHSPFHTAPLPLCLPSLAAASAGAPVAGKTGEVAPSASLRHHYYPELDPFELGVADREAAGRLQAACPRYFMLAGCYDLHAPSARDVGSASTIAASAVNLTLRSMAGSSCMMEPVAKRLPLNMTVGAVKQLAARLFRNDPSLQRLSFRDTQGAYPSLLDDDSKTLGYYAVADGGELLIEEIDPAEAARQAAEERRKADARLAEQVALGDALHRAHEASVAADRRAVLSTAAPALAPAVAAAAKPVAGSLAAAAPPRVLGRKPAAPADDDDAI